MRKTRRANRRRARPSLLDSNTPQDVRMLSTLIDLVSPDNIEAGSLKLSATEVVGRHTTRGSFSPSINEHLRYSEEVVSSDIFGCQDVRELIRSDVPLIQATINNKKVCVKYSTKIAQDVMLKRLSTIAPDPRVLIPPKQIQSNCWFNTMFLALFVSDKGVKFFRYFRHLMITGKRANGRRINAELWDAFVRLNLSIDACHTGNPSCYRMDTNIHILNIHNAICGERPEYKEVLPRPGYARRNEGNGSHYYDMIIRYLDDRVVRHYYHAHADASESSLRRSVEKLEYVPHMIIVESNQGRDTWHEGLISLNGVSYKCDSIIMTDIDVHHAICLLTVGRRGYAFDGQSYSRLIPFDWWSEGVIDFTDFRFQNKRGALIHSIRAGYCWFWYYRI